jgi:hypothetical protein
VKEDGIATLMHNDLYYWKNEKGSDLILFTSDAQPATSEMEYSLSEKVLDFLIAKYRTRELVTLGAYVTGVRSASPKVYGAGTDLEHAKKLQELGCTLMHYGEIKGMNGLMLGMAKLKGISGYAFLGETEGYTFDGRASGNLLVCLGKLVGMKVDLLKLERRAKEAQELLNAVIETEAQRNQENNPESESRGPNYIT